MKDKHYYLTMESKKCDNVFIDYNRLNGFKITPKNKIKYDGVVVNEMVLMNPSFINRVLKRKIKRRLDKYLEYIVEIIDDTDDYGNLTVKNKTVFHLEYIYDYLNTIDEDTKKEDLKKHLMPSIKTIKTLLNEASRNRIARKIHRELEPLLDEFSDILNKKKNHDIKKIRKQLIVILQEMFKILTTIDDEDGNIVEMALDDLAKYKSIIINRYQAYLDKHYVELLLKKIEIINRELRMKKIISVQYEEPIYDNEYDMDLEDVKKTR